MAFIGSVPKEARLVIKEIMTDVDEKLPVYVGCSGNFVIDRICQKMGRKVYSNDVSLYSKLVADAALGRDTDIVVTVPKYREIFDRWEEHKYKKLIMVMFIMKISEFEDCKNDFKTNGYNNMLAYSGDFYKATLAKLEKSEALEFGIEDFYFGDFRDHLANNQGVGLLFAPTYTGGYEKMYNRVEEVFEYEKADYRMFNTDDAEGIYKELLETSQIIIYSDNLFKDIEHFMVSRILMPDGKRDIYIYSSVKSFKRTILIDSHTPKVLKKTYPILPKDFKFTENTEIRVLESKLDMVNHYKHLYMSARVDYSEGGDFGLLMFADGMVFGFASFSKFLGTRDKRDIFLQSDFCVPHEKRLSKLVASLLLSEEVRDICIKKFAYAYNGIQTSVYTEKPVSMKYRGVFKLLDRNVKEKKLTYKGSFKGERNNQIYLKWLKKN